MQIICFMASFKPPFMHPFSTRGRQHPGQVSSVQACLWTVGENIQTPHKEIQPETFLLSEDSTNHFIILRSLWDQMLIFLQFHYLCFFPVFLFFKASIQAGRAGRRAGDTSSITGCSTSQSCSITESSSDPESFSESVASRSSSGGSMANTSSEKRTRRFSSTRLWCRER